MLLLSCGQDVWEYLDNFVWTGLPPLHLVCSVSTIGRLWIVVLLALHNRCEDRKCPLTWSNKFFSFTGGGTVHLGLLLALSL